MADLGVIFLRRRYPIHWYQSSYIFITGSMPFRYFWATLYRKNNFSYFFQYHICWGNFYGWLSKPQVRKLCQNTFAPNLGLDRYRAHEMINASLPLKTCCMILNILRICLVRNFQKRKNPSEIHYDIWYSYKTKIEAFMHLMKCYHDQIPGCVGYWVPCQDFQERPRVGAGWFWPWRIVKSIVTFFFDKYGI